MQLASQQQPIIIRYSTGCMMWTLDLQQ